MAEGESSKEGKGRHINCRTTTEFPEISENIAQLIKSFEVKEVHYLSGLIKYLNSQLNVKIMHSLFNEKFSELQVSYCYYYNYFKENYYLRFGRPDVDVCSKCEELKTKPKGSSLNDTVNRTVDGELTVHTRSYRKSYKKIKNIEKMCRQRNDVILIYRLHEESYFL